MFWEHIEIPFDEINIFRHEEQHQEALKQTLLLSTLAVLHEVVVTLKQIWLTQTKHKKTSVPLKQINGVLKSLDHPEIVLITTEEFENIRISTSSMQRCWYIISAISYTLTLHSNNLNLYTIKQGQLDYFERTSKQKKKGYQVSLHRYPKVTITYLKPIGKIQHLFGFIKIDKLTLQKQLQIQSINEDHSLYIAKTNMQKYFCHFLPKQQSYVRRLLEHENRQKIQLLIYAKATQYKIQLFFEYGSSIRGMNSPQMFKQLWKLYDIAKKINKFAVITTDSFIIIDDEVKIRQFRYPFLNEPEEIQKIKYEKIAAKSYFQDKLYTLGIILYELTFGQNLFTHDCIETLIEIKKQFQDIIYPKYLGINFSSSLKDFLETCLLMKISTEEEFFNHAWLKS